MYNPGPGSGGTAEPAPVVPLITELGSGYRAYAGLVTVQAGNVPAYDAAADAGWFLYPAATPFTAAALNAPAQYSSGDANPAGTFVASYYAADTAPAPTELPAGWLLANTTSTGLLMSQRGLTAISHSLNVPAGSRGWVDMTGATIWQGEDWWGVPGSALPLNAALAVDGAARSYLTYPLEDVEYDVSVSGSYYVNPVNVADIGKEVSIRFAGNNSQEGPIWMKTRESPDHDPSADFSCCFSDVAFVGDVPGAGVRVFYDASSLANETLLGFGIILISRTTPPA